MSAGHHDQREDLFNAMDALGRDAIRKLSTPVAPRTTADKHFATLQARAALSGIQLVQSHMERGGVEYIASLHSLTRAFSTLAEVDAWLTRVEGRPA